MKKRASILLITLSLFGTLAAISAYAQSVERFEVIIPFSFTLGDKTFPAGRYSIEPVSFAGTSLNSKLLIRSTDGHRSTLVSTLPIQASAMRVESKLVFSRYGDQYFLSRAWMAGSSAGREIRKSRAEERLAKSAVAPQSVSISAGQQ